MDAGTVDNTATASATTPAGTAVRTQPDSTSTPTDTTAALTLDKQAGTPVDVNQNGRVDAGDTVGYRFVVTNTGVVTLTDVRVVDARLPAVSCPTSSLAPGASTTCTATATLTQAAVDAGTLDNSATVTGTTPRGDRVDSPADTTSTRTDSHGHPDRRQAGRSDPVDVDGDGRIEAGDTVDYRFTVTNTGAVTLTDVAVADARVPSVSCPSSTLAPGASTTCTATATITQADVDAGAVTNDATATATDPRDQPVVSAADRAVTPTSDAASLIVDKVAGTPEDVDGDGRIDEGDTVPFTFTVTNTGALTLSGVGVDDDRTGEVACAPAQLAPGASADCAAVSVITQADVDAGSVDNVASAFAARPDGSSLRSDADATSTPTSTAATLTLDKTAGIPVDINRDNRVDAGDTVGYTFAVTNTGAVTLSQVGVDDARVGAVSCPTSTVPPESTIVCTATATITQADVDAGSVDNAATAVGTTPGGTPVRSGRDTTSTPTSTVTQLELDKSADTPVDVNQNSRVDAGDTIGYRFLVTNTGATTVSSIAVQDPSVPQVGCPVTTLAPGASTTCAGSDVITQADVDAGSVVNTAIVTGRGPGGAALTSQPDSTTTRTDATATLTLDKRAAAPADVNRDSRVDAGDTIAYAFTVTNTGAVTLASVRIDDPTVTRAGRLPPAAAQPGREHDLPGHDDDHPGAGRRRRRGQRRRRPGREPEPGAGDLGDRQHHHPDQPRRRARPRQDGRHPGRHQQRRQGGRRGHGPLHLPHPQHRRGHPGRRGRRRPARRARRLLRHDPGPGRLEHLHGDVHDHPGRRGRRRGGQHRHLHPRPRRQVSASPPHPPRPPPRPAASPCSSSTSRRATRVDEDGDGRIGAGDTVAYRFTLTNTGAVTLTSVAVEDDLLGAVDCPAGPLAPGGSTTCDAPPHPITQAEVDAGAVVNEATALAVTPAGTDVRSASDSTRTPVATVLGLALDKTVAGIDDLDGDGRIDAGDTVAYTFTLTNTGVQTLGRLSIADRALAGPADCPAGRLAPGQTAACSGVHTITQAEVDAGTVDNTAVATGLTSLGEATTSTPDSTSTPTSTDATLFLDKRAGTPVDVDDNSRVDAGDTIVYTFAVTNTGAVTLTRVAVDDPRTGTVRCPATTLAPGASTTCTAALTITQDEVDAGGVDNVATASGTTPAGRTQVSEPDTTRTPTDSTATLQLDKTASAPVDVDGDGLVEAGDTVGYTFTLTNTGTVTLDGVAVDDPTVGPVGCPATTLAPGASTTCAVTYVLTQADVDAGSVDNTATASALTRGGAPVAAGPDSTSTATSTDAALSLDKRADAPVDVNGNGRVDAGDTVAYTFVVTNTGVVTLADVAVADPTTGPVDCPSTTLTPGASISCTAGYTITQADVDAAAVVNRADASGTAPDGRAVRSAPDTTTTPTDTTLGLELDKSVAGVDDVDGDRRVDVGDTVDYRFVVTNTGAQTLTGVAVTDALLDQPAGCTPSRLVPGQQAVCSATYTITQADVDAGAVANSATATGAGPADAGVASAPDTTTTATDVTLTLTLVKRAGAPSTPTPTAGWTRATPSATRSR